MRDDLRSYWRTIEIVLAGAVASAAAGFWLTQLVEAAGHGTLAGIGRLAAAVVTTAFLAAAGCGLIVVLRTKRVDAGRSDLFLARNACRSGLACDGANGIRTPSMRWLRRLLGAPMFLVGDRVRIRTLEQIAATLNPEGSLGGLPFMPEMARYCGQSAVVFRCVDKVYDYGGQKDLRRIRDVALLHGLRCDGSAHDRCQAGCYLLWKHAWLEPLVVPSADHCPRRSEDTDRASNLAGLLQQPRVSTGQGIRYRCQYTQLVTASQPMNVRDPRQDLRPLLAGNVTFAAFAVALATRAFNSLQNLRRGIGYPWIPVTSNNQSMHAEYDLSPGEMVEVRSVQEMATTLTGAGKNRGLWFDRDMVKHAGRRFAVNSRVTQIIDDASGRMLVMKWPCIVLEGVDGSGEYLRFTAQHDRVFWREVWLRRIDVPTDATACAVPRSTGTQP